MCVKLGLTRGGFSPFHFPRLRWGFLTDWIISWSFVLAGGAGVKGGVDDFRLLVACRGGTRKRERERDTKPGHRDETACEIGVGVI